jgi:hypothetical protein
MAVLEQRTDGRREYRCGESQPGSRLERNAVVHNGFGVAIGCDAAFVLPSAHAEHRRFLAE